MIKRLIIYMILVITTVSCSNNSSTTATSLSGTAAVGAPLPNASVVLKDADGVSQTVTANANGEFTFSDINALKAPFILKAVGTVGGEEQTMYSALDEKPSAGGSGVINVTPLTHAVVAQLAPSGDPSALFSAPSTLGTVITPAAMSSAKERSVEAIKSVMQELGITNFDPFKDKFTANSTGRDKLFDLVKFQPSADGSIKVTDKASGVQMSIGKNDTPTAVAAKKLVIDPDVAKIDFSTIKTLASNLILAMTNKSSSSLSVLIDDNFLHNGMIKNTFVNVVTSEANVALVDFVIGGCDKISKICLGNATLKTTKGSVSFVQNEPMPVKQQIDGSWKLFGNQQAFKFELTPMVVVKTSSATRPAVTATTGLTIESGLNIRINTYNDPSGSIVNIYLCQELSPATSSSPASVGCETTPFAELKVLEASGEKCPVYSLNETCDETFRVVSSLEREGGKTAIESGKVRIKVERLRPGSPTDEKIIKFDLPYFSDDDIKAVAGRALNVLNYGELNTTSVTLNAKTIKFGAHLSGYSFTASDYPIRLEEDRLVVARADGKISVSELCSSGPDPRCSTGAVLSYVEQEFRDDVLPVRVALKATYPQPEF